jgi:predicted dehydrogenase
MSLKALVVGLGQIGMGYDLKLDPRTYVLTHARAFQQHPRFSLVGGVDANLSRCRIFEEHYGCSAYTDLEKALQITRPDVIAIATPTPLHGATLRTILDFAEPAAILCEKPLSYDIDEAHLMVEECLSRKCGLYVNYMRRSDPGVVKVKRRLDEADIGSPVKGIVWYSKGLFHNGSHFFNLLQFWLGEMKDFKVIATGRLWDGVDPEPDVQVIFEHGTITFLAAREEDYSHYTVELVAPNGRLRVDQGGEKIIWQPVVRSAIADGYSILSHTEERIETGMMRSQWNVLDQLAASLDGSPAQICTGAAALKTLESLEKIRAKL